MQLSQCIFASNFASYYLNYSSIVCCYKYIILLFSFLGMMPLILLGQSPKQGISGVILDTGQKVPLPNVTIELLNFYPLKIVQTDINGKFVIGDIPSGKYKLLFQKKGYEDAVVSTKVVPGQVTSIKQNLKKIQASGQKLSTAEKLRQEFYQQQKEEEIEKKEINTFEESDDPILQPGYHNLSPQSLYLAIGTRQDFLRFLSNQGGLSPLSDMQAAPVVRGNAPNSLQYRLEGLPIELPIHLRSIHATNRGQNGILSLNSIGKSSLLLGALAPEYGNALEGVLDLRLRRTKTQRKISFMAEYSTATGIGLSIEGPISREKYGSFVINYRYSAFNPLQYGLEQGLNLHQTSSEYKTAPILQDVSFKLNLPSRESNQISFFGLVSIAQQNIFGTDSLLSSTIYNLRPQEDELFRTNYFVGGVNYKKTWGNNYRNYWKTTLGATYFTVNNVSETRDKDEITRPTFSHENWNYAIKINSTVYQQISPFWSIKAGLLLDHSCYSFHDIYYQVAGMRPSARKLDTRTTLLQTYAQIQYQPSSKLKTYIGFNSNFFVAHPMLQDAGLEPRFGLQWQMAENHQLEIAYGMHSQKLPTIMLFDRAGTSNGNEWQPNTKLKTPTAHLVNLAYQWSFAERWRLKASFYYQYQHNIVIDSLYPAINHIHYGSQYYRHELLPINRLINAGCWHKIGGDFIIEKYLGDGYFGMIALSFVQTMQARNNETTSFRAPSFGATFSPKFIAGKSFRMGPIRRNRIRLELKFVYAHDQYTIPIDTLSSINTQRTVYDYSKGFSRQIPDYWRLDLRVAMTFRPRKNDEIFHYLAIELLNIVNTKNVGSYYFNPNSQAIETRYQLPLYLEVLYRARF